jgi:predicted nucleic acid-binding protein
LAARAGNVVPSDLFLSVITLEELEIGILLAERRDPAKGAVFRQWMNTQVLPTFSGRVFPVDLTVALRCATARRRRGAFAAFTTDCCKLVRPNRTGQTTYVFFMLTFRSQP